MEPTKPLGLPNREPAKSDFDADALTDAQIDALTDAQIDALIIRIDTRRTAVKPTVRRQWLYHTTKEPKLVEGATAIMHHLADGWFDTPDAVKFKIG